MSGALERAADMRRVTLVGAWVNVALSIIKVALGIVGRSHALIVDGIHSFSDLLSDLVVLYAAKHSANAPDEEHPYGHGRFETAATLALGALLVLIAGGISWDALSRMLFGGEAWMPSAFALLGALMSILVKEALYWYTLAVAKSAKSEMIRANAWHHRSDAISSVVVLIGIIGAMLGFPWLDVLAALIVGLMIAKIGWDLGSESLKELVDVSLEPQKIEHLRQAIESVDGVRGIHMLRTRRLAHQALADVHVLVAPWISVSEGHMIALAVEDSIKQSLPEVADVTVHIDPEDDADAPKCQGLPLRSQVMEALRQAWPEHNCEGLEKRVLLHYLAGRVRIEMQLPAECRDNDSVLGLAERLADQAWFGGLKLHFRG